MLIMLDGKKIAESIREEITSQVERLRQKDIIPKLAVVLAGNDPASVLYAQAKGRACKKTGIDYQLFELPDATPEKEMLDLIRSLNRDEAVHGIMVELPLPSGMNKKEVLQAVSPLKDVDGVHPINRGLLLSGGDGLFPVTPQSCLEIIQRSGLTIAGKHAVLVGRGETVGKPLIFMMLNQNATVTVCHTKTADLGYFTRQADIVVVAVGKPNTITADMVKPGAIIVDAGINETDSGICGDVDFQQVQQVAGAISPVPGGVGSLTTALLQKNLLKAIELSGK
ncbi:MAG: bifunctional 5,10-methylenetetrahydrofolate dehydrogenase/5,10-methenyltetrahydrofolate cyclohydrolase [Peptococcaceae bacterium]|nr:bifunctional 5,10-methylenetetrahydrofolate dehydrogenase/5,10-methenyltetrahydrofolate cyclohydrolase [Peptococcaceae bacterium]